jgi:hypothetical protein
MRTRFAEHLASKGLIDSAAAKRVVTRAREFREVEAAMALRHDLLGPEQMEEVLKRLSPTARFGRVARDLGYLSDEQVDTLSIIQDLQDALEVGQALILDGSLKRADLLREMVEFFSRTERPAPAGGEARAAMD